MRKRNQFDENAAKHARVVDEIHALLDGKEWSADTLEAIAEVLERNGFHIRNFED